MQKGSKSKGMNLADVAKLHGMTAQELMPQLRKGIRHEYEHTTSKQVARRTALDHLVEFPDYYDRLDKIEKMHLGGDMSKHLAPNGKPSNLNHEQWHLVRTPEFKAWFGDWENDPQNASKVVDENGEPLVVYHGTIVENAFNTFDYDKADLGFHFGTKEQAQNRIKSKKQLPLRKSMVNPFFLNIRILFEMTDVGEWEYPQRYIDELMSDNIIEEKIAKQKGFLRFYDRKDNTLIRDYIKSKYGNSVGFVYNNKYEGEGKSFIALSNNQIKLADGSNTTFYSENPDIRFHLGGDMSKHLAPNGKPSNLNHEQWHLVRTPEFKAWFGDWENDPQNASKVVDENGEPLVVYHGTRDGRFNIFDRKYFGIRTQNVNSIAFFFTPDLWYAKAYSESDNNKRIKEYIDIFGETPKAIEPRPFAEEKMCFLYIKNPKYVKSQTKDEILLAKEQNYDGIILKTSDGRFFEIGVFKSNQIKLADGSNTTFDSENADIRFHLGGDMSKHLAPNGKPSNLNHEQWHLVRTPEFKAWFGDWENDPQNASKVVDENGEPLVLWHYAKTLKYELDKFYIFNVDKQLGSHFGSLRQSQKIKSPNQIIINEEPIDFKYYQVFLNIRNPIRLKDVGIFESDTLIDAIGSENIEDSDWYYINNFNGKSEDTYVDRVKFISKSKFGYDGAVYLNRYESDAKTSFIISLDEVSDKIFKNKVPSAEDSWIAFEPNQIKLADGSNTTFDGSNPDIRFKRGGRTIAQTPAPISERIYGSKKNVKGSAASKVNRITFTTQLTKSIKNKVDEHNEEYPDNKVTLATAKAVVRRGMGAYSKSHRPTISGGMPNSRQAWGLARLNKFLMKKSGKPVKKAYIQDDDLL